MRHQGEPSVEEILESIKKVIARDNRETLQAERRHRENAGVAQPVPQPFAEDEDEDEDEILDLGQSTIDPAPAEPGLIGESTSRAMRDSLAALAMLSEPGAAPQIVRSGETSLEGLTRDLLRPMLARWLDENLPPIVERLVKAEIARIAGKKG